MHCLGIQEAWSWPKMLPWGKSLVSFQGRGILEVFGSPKEEGPRPHSLGGEPPPHGFIYGGNQDAQDPNALHPKPFFCAPFLVLGGAAQWGGGHLPCFHHAAQSSGVDSQSSARRSPAGSLGDLFAALSEARPDGYWDSVPLTRKLKGRSYLRDGASLEEQGVKNFSTLDEVGSILGGGCDGGTTALQRKFMSQVCGAHIHFPT